MQQTKIVYWWHSDTRVFTVRNFQIVACVPYSLFVKQFSGSSLYNKVVHCIFFHFLSVWHIWLLIIVTLCNALALLWSYNVPYYDVDWGLARVVRLVTSATNALHIWTCYLEFNHVTASHEKHYSYSQVTWNMAQRRFTCILNASCVVEKPGQRRKIETCPDILALVKKAGAEPSNEAAVSDSYSSGAYACLRCYRRLERIVKGLIQLQLYLLFVKSFREQVIAQGLAITSRKGNKNISP